MTQELDELWGRIESLTRQLKDTPSDAGTALLLSAAVDMYIQKLRDYHGRPSTPQHRRSSRSLLEGLE
jgi:hypothetical protein